MNSHKNPDTFKSWIPPPDGNFGVVKEDVFRERRCMVALTSH